MPTYEYRCRDCGHTFDIVQKMSDEPLTHCPECGGALRKVFAPPAISFKGSGFYATDHGKKARPAADGSRGETKKKDGESATSKDAADATPAPKKESSGDASSSTTTTTKKEGSS